MCPHRPDKQTDQKNDGGKGKRSGKVIHVAYLQWTMKRLRNIRRVDNKANRTYAWLVQVQRNNQITMKMFSDSVYGGKRKALQAAIAFRTQLLGEMASHYEHQIWRRSVLRRNNTSGIPGVARYENTCQPQYRPPGNVLACILDR